MHGFNRLTNGYALVWPIVVRASHPAAAPVGGGRSAIFLYQKDDISIVVLTNLMGANPDQFIDELAGIYIPEMKEINGFGLPINIAKFRTALLEQGFEKAEMVLKTLISKEMGFQLKENELNAWAYKLYSQKQTSESLFIFKLIVKVYPESANAYDSMGEIMELTGNNSEAITNYRKSLDLNPLNENAKARIKVLLER